MDGSDRWSSGALAALADRYLAAQLGGDRREALRVITEEGVGQAAPVEDLHTEVIQAAPHEIGRRWQRDGISVAQEHMATAISQFVIARLYHRLPRAAANGRCVVVACVEGELHDVSARMTADFLKMAPPPTGAFVGGSDVRALVTAVEERLLQ